MANNINLQHETQNIIITDNTIQLSPDIHNPIPQNNNNKNTIQQSTQYYHNIALEFINKNKKDLARIYIQHTTTNIDEDKQGVLGIYFGNIEQHKKIDVAFMPLRLLPENIITKINNEHQNTNNINIIYFILITPLEEQIIAIDIRTLTE